MLTSLTSLPSNLRPTTCKCVHLVMRGNVQSRDKYGSHTTRSAIAENTMLCKTHGTRFIRVQFYVAGLSTFNLFCSCDLDIELMTFIFLTHIHWRYNGCVKINFLRQVCQKLSYYSLQMHGFSYVWSTKTVVTPFDLSQPKTP